MRKTINDLEDPKNSENSSITKKSVTKSIPPGPEIVTNTGTSQEIWSNEDDKFSNKEEVMDVCSAENTNYIGQNMAMPQAVVAEAVHIADENGENGPKENQNEGNGQGLDTKQKPWYQNAVTMSFIAFVLLLVAGVAIAIPLILKGSSKPDPPPRPPTTPPNIAVTAEPTMQPTMQPTKQPTKQPTVPLPRCNNDADCNGEECAYESYTPNSESVCCKEDSVRVWSSDDSAFPKGGSSAYFCAGQPTDARCPFNNLCESGVCVQKSCKDGLQATDEVCDDNNDCASFVCVNNSCKAGTQGTSSPCDDDNDCTSVSCAYESYTPNSGYACCAGDSVRVWSSDDSAFPKGGSSAWFCAGQPTGARCPFNNLCESNVCVNNVCQA